VAHCATSVVGTKRTCCGSLPMSAVGGRTDLNQPRPKVRFDPTAEWVARQITEAFPWDEAPRYLIRDRDRIYGSAVTRRLRAMGIRDKPTAPASPWQNGFAERLIGSIRRECVDHIIVLGEMHLRQILQSYARYYDPVS
jgi:transposase InsO family protein